jgi:hypothetical protein
MDDEKFYYCKSCSSEFDPFAEDVKVLHESHGVIIIQDRSGRAHSLTLTSWNKIKRVRELEDHARPINPVNLYQEQNDGFSEEVTRDDGVIEEGSSDELRQ